MVRLHPVVALVCAFASLSPAATYYVDCEGGDDASDGRSDTTAWRSVGKASTFELTPGDSLRLRRGTVCRGSLTPRGSGTAEAPLVVDAWGTGPLPKIEAPPDAKAAFRLFDQEYWVVQNLEFAGGSPHGVFVTGSKGVLHGIHIRNLVVHDVVGNPLSKETGLVAIVPGSKEQRFDDVLVEGVTAFRTTQWSGILVGGADFGALPLQNRSTNVRIRDCMVHDVAGDGIVLFQVNDGVIENSVAWRTGLQRKETIGTPNGIWTWMCHNCVVRRSEAFLTDSPGVDGGAFDIDFGNSNNTVEESYGHHTDGYCVSIFGAGTPTSNSLVRGNTCFQNGRDPKMAKRQGAIFLSTWNKGRIDSVRISENRVLWNPPVRTAAIVSTARITGEGAIRDNILVSSIPQLFRGKRGLVWSGNTITSTASPAQSLGGQFPSATVRDAAGKDIVLPLSKSWQLYAFVPPSGAGRMLAACAHRQFRPAGLRTVLITDVGREDQTGNLAWDWNLGDIPVLFDSGSLRKALHPEKLPSFVLVDDAGRIAWRGEAVPGDLGLALRQALGDPDFTRLISEH
ncbi:MAG: right-handed parallel beta-helix repeat-containing protein [Bryobacteraceae bacterium]